MWPLTTYSNPINITLHNLQCTKHIQHMYMYAKVLDVRYLLVNYAMLQVNVTGSLQHNWVAFAGGANKHLLCSQRFAPLTY